MVPSSHPQGDWAQKAPVGMAHVGYRSAGNCRTWVLQYALRLFLLPAFVRVSTMTTDSSTNLQLLAFVIFEEVKNTIRIVLIKKYRLTDFFLFCFN